jgi:hypothetical protein
MIQPEIYSYDGVPAMTPPIVHSYLEELGRGWQGKGAAVEFGCWLGATSMALLKGLVAAGYDRSYYAFDRWRATADEVSKAQHQGVKLAEGQDLMPIYGANVHRLYPMITTIQGDMDCGFQFFRNPSIEVCLLDAPKKDPLFGHIMTVMAKSWIPRVTVVGLLDYHFYKRRPGELEYFAPVNYMAKHAQHFEKMIDWPEQTSAAFFRYLG